jgi:DNA processing protein
VVQAPLKSGALITSDFALQEGREVMVTPSGMIMEGTASLVEEGASLVETAWQVLKILNTPAEVKAHSWLNRQEERI